MKILEDGLENLLRDVVRQAVLQEREACAAAICEGCARGWPTEDRDGDRLHLLPEELRRPWTHGRGTHTGCDAAGIWARA